jgi:DNA-binding NarL/FixJ family response regulator
VNPVPADLDEAGSAAPAIRVVVADDSTLFRRGLAGLLEAAGVEVVAEVGDVPGVLAAVAVHQPDAVILDVRMPPTHGDEGIRAALEIRETSPKIGVLVLSTYAESEWVTRLLENGSRGLGYLLKDRVDDVHALLGALRRVASGGTAVDPELVSNLLSTRSQTGPMTTLSPRELDVLQLMAEGFSNAGISRRLHLSPRTVETHVAALFGKLSFHPEDGDLNRRVLAVLAFLRRRTDA